MGKTKKGHWPAFLPPISALNPLAFFLEAPWRVTFTFVLAAALDWKAWTSKNENGFRHLPFLSQIEILLAVRKSKNASYSFRHCPLVKTEE